MIQIIKSKLRYKIMFLLVLLMGISSCVTIFITTENIKKNNIIQTKKSLEMLNESIFQTLKNAMNTGVTQQIVDAEEAAREIEGVRSLVVAKSQALIEMYSPQSTFTKDTDILNTFKLKKTAIFEYTEDNHIIRMIKPMIASNECIMCHANQKVGDVIGVIDLSFSLEDADAQLLETLFDVILASVILGGITLLVMFYILKKSTQPIEVLESGIKSLTQNNTNSKIRVNSSDEVGKVAYYFNEYIQKIENNKLQDSFLIAEAQEVIEKVKHGIYDSSIQSTTENESLEKFKISVNEMISSTHTHFCNINKVLEKYSTYNYIDTLVLENIESQCIITQLVDNINILRDSITSMLIENKTNGLTLESSSNTLLSNVGTLNQNSNNAAAALEETVAAIEQITSNISNNTQHIIEMSELASEVTQSASGGEVLAHQTTNAMNEIDDEVNAINEAIILIDEIAFQTNILSLNAAVEAATAGDAGKGFAVVAQEIRNLATRSTSVANEIKKLVENAIYRSNNGKNIANQMIDGYTSLNQNISKTINLIENVETASKEQLLGIQQINDAVNSLDQQTQQNAVIASQTHDVAMQTDAIAKLVVNDADEKQFVGKDLSKEKKSTDTLK